MTELNCGITALSGITSLKNISMYTIIQLAKDNGINFFFCRVDKKDFPLVIRPAIFHADEHFVLIEADKPIPDFKYTGWVLTIKPFGIPLPFSVAKQITGGKKGGDVFGPIVTGIASIVNPFLGAAVGMGFAAHKATGGRGVTPTKGEFWRIPLAGVGGYLGGTTTPLIKGISNANLAGFAAGAAELPSAIKTGNYMAPITAGIGAALGQKATSLASTGFHAPAAGIGERLLNTGKVAFGGTPTRGGVPLVPSVGPPTGSNIFSGGAGQVASSMKTMSAQTPNASQGVKGIFSNILGGDKKIMGFDGGDMLRLGGAAVAGGMMKPPEAGYNSEGEYNRLRELMGGQNVPKHTNDQLNRWISMPIQDIKNEMLTPGAGNRSMLEIDKKYQEAVADVKRQAAQYGQSEQTSSDVQRRVDEINRQWGESKANLQGELEQKATQDAIDIKKWSLEQSMAQGQFDTKAALELAAMVNKDKELTHAIQTQNYQAFQDIIAEILGNDYAQKKEEKRNPSENLSSTMGQR